MFCFVLSRKFLKFTCLSVLVTAITEILTRSVAYKKCSDENNCHIELMFIMLGVVYSISSIGMIYKMLTAPSSKKRCS
jgi:hypothetical protein